VSDRLRIQQLAAVRQQLRTPVNALTGYAELLLENHAGDAVLAEAWRRGRLSARPVELLLLDVDALKKYHDHYGNLAGDACLLCPDTDADGLRALDEAVCAQIRG
jgi:PleD family two-component response regulator